MAFVHGPACSPSININNGAVAMLLAAKQSRVAVGVGVSRQAKDVVRGVKLRG
jgi:hypothetical protein